ncbi:hypothetical protein [Flavobacterium covae]|uniref:hypothetical protein n=1 Tax=Flavobacterium covae TaxID=2906076 RepID=UPI0035E46239
MNPNEIKQRLKVLYLVLQFHSQYQSKFTTGERIVINQERGKLLQLLQNTEQEPRPVPAGIEKKIKEVLHLVDSIDWIPLNFIDFIDE